MMKIKKTAMRLLSDEKAGGTTFSVEHYFSCSTGGFPVIRQNDVRAAKKRTEDCSNVEEEAHLGR